MHITQAEYDALVRRGHLPPLDKKPRPPDPYKSKAERLYAWELERRKEIGEIVFWAYEPVTLVIVSGEKRCRYTPDFMVVYSYLYDVGYTLEFVEVKGGSGFCREAARIRFLAARERYPFWLFSMVRRHKSSWETIL